MPKGTILIVEDDLDILTMLALYLENQGFEILRAPRGSDGIEIASTKQPDLVILDIMLPDIDGWEVLEKLKEKRIPTRVIMLTQVHELHEVIRFIKAGACDYVTKPFDVEELLNRIRRALTLESAVNLRRVNDMPPVVNQLMEKAEELRQQYDSLTAKMESLDQQNATLAKQLDQQNATLVRQEEELEQQVAALEEESLKLTSNIKNRWIGLGIRLIYLLAATLVTVLFFLLHIITNTQSLFLLPLIIFFMLLFPIEKVRKLSAQYREAETKVEVNSLDE